MLFADLRVWRFRSFLALFFVLLLPSVSLAQANRGLSGSVLDPDGKAVANAAVVVRNEATGATRTVVTDDHGAFALGDLAPATYAVEVLVPGFETVRRAGVRVAGDPVTTLSIQLTIANITETVIVSSALPEAAVAAPSQGSLTARSAQSLISNEFIRNYTSPISDYSQVLQMAPGTFNVSANGPGLGDTKTFFRGFKDGQYSMTYDGIPFNDTNDPTHHSWVFFPAQTIGSTVFERSPGSAASIGPSTYGGSVNLLSRSLGAQPLLNGTVSYGSFNTRMLDVEFNSGRFGPDGRSRFMVDAHEMRSDGYQTFNFQKRDAFSAKYQYAIGDNTTLTGFASVMELHANTPNQKGSTRAQIAQFGDNFLMTDDPNSPLYYKFNFYDVPTNFEYFGVRTLLGKHWSIDNRTYTMRYYNKQNYNGMTAISATSATDKLNSYWKVGNLLPVSYVSDHGIFRTGLWSEYASTDRYQMPSDPRTWVDAALPNFHEMFGTTTLQPFAEYELRLPSRRDGHAGHQVRVLQAGLHPVPRQRQDRRQPQRRAVPQARRDLSRRAAVARHAHPAAVVLVVVRAVRARAEHSAEQRVRRQERPGDRAAEADSDRDGAGGIGLEVAAGDARPRLLPHPFPERLLGDDRSR